MIIQILDRIFFNLKSKKSKILYAFLKLFNILFLQQSQLFHAKLAENVSKFIKPELNQKRHLNLSQ